MRRPKKRTVLILAAILLLVGITVIVWEVADWPPPRLILKYGFPPTGGPTGRTRTINGTVFIEMAPGYRWIERYPESPGVDLFDQIRSTVEGWLERDAEDRGDLQLIDLCVLNSWLEVERTFWITERPIDWYLLDNVWLFGEERPLQPDAEALARAREIRDRHARGCREGSIRFAGLRRWEYAVLGGHRALRTDVFEGVAGPDDSLVDAQSGFLGGPDGMDIPGTTPAGFRLVWIPPEDSE